MNSKTYLAAALLAATQLTSLNTSADTLSISAGAGGWGQASDGNFQKTTDPSAVDLNDNLFWQDETQTYAFVTFEHFVPIIPNVRIMHTSLDQAGSGNTNFIFDGQQFGDPNGNEIVSNDFSFETLDLLAYYEVLDNVVSLDLGLNIRNITIDYTIVNGAAVNDSVDETIPMLYAMVGASPWPDLIISGEVSYISFDGSTMSDFIAKVAYTTDFFVGFEAGYRNLTLELDDVSETDADMTFDGLFAGAYLKF
jgi:outer membrane protein